MQKVHMKLPASAVIWVLSGTSKNGSGFQVLLWGSDCNSIKKYYPFISQILQIQLPLMFDNYSWTNQWANMGNTCYRLLWSELCVIYNQYSCFLYSVQCKHEKGNKFTIQYKYSKVVIVILICQHQMHFSFLLSYQWLKNV